MKQWISRNFLQLIIIAFFIVFGLRECSHKNNGSSLNHSDTTHFVTYTHHDTLIISKPELINTYHTITKSDSVFYRPSTNYDSLLTQYNSVRDSLLSYNIYKDRKNIDSASSVEIVDTIHNNKIFGRSIKADIVIPVKTTVINNYIYPKPKAQFFIGANITGNQGDVLQGVGIGTMYISKKDAAWQFSAQYNFKQGISYQLSRYFPIKLHK